MYCFDVCIKKKYRQRERSLTMLWSWWWWWCVEEWKWKFSGRKRERKRKREDKRKIFVYFVTNTEEKENNNFNLESFFFDSSFLLLLLFLLFACLPSSFRFIRNENKSNVHRTKKKKNELQWEWMRQPLGTMGNIQISVESLSTGISWLVAGALAVCLLLQQTVASHCARVEELNSFGSLFLQFLVAAVYFFLIFCGDFFFLEKCKFFERIVGF